MGRRDRKQNTLNWDGFLYSKIYCKGLNILIAITKLESEKIRSVYPKAEIVRTCPQKSKRHHYYLPEAEQYLRLINDSNFEATRICHRIDVDRERKRKYGHRFT